MGFRSSWFKMFSSRDGCRLQLADPVLYISLCFRYYCCCTFVLLCSNLHAVRPPFAASHPTPCSRNNQRKSYYLAPTPVSLPVSQPNGVFMFAVLAPNPPPPSDSGFADANDSFLTRAASCTVKYIHQYDLPLGLGRRRKKNAYPRHRSPQHWFPAPARLE